MLCRTPNMVHVDMKVHAQKRRTPSGAKAAEGVVEAKARTVPERSPNLLPASPPHVETDSQLVELSDQVWALALSIADQSQELSQLKGGIGIDPLSIAAFLQAQRQAFLKYDLLALVGEAWELKRILIIRRNTIAWLTGGPVQSDIDRDRIKASMGSEERVEAFFDEVRLTPSNDASVEMPVYVVHALAERLWRSRNGNIPVSLAASIAWLVLPGYERRQWLGRAAFATTRAARDGPNPASILAACRT
jgi:hypothetical protein